MEYTLQELNKKAYLKTLKTGEFTDKLNLIGTEVDDLLLEQNQENKWVKDIRVVLKIPANREDLMNETFFLNDLSNLFSFPLKRKWKIAKKNYTLYFQDIYKKSKNHQTSPIISGFPEIKTYIFKTNITNKTNSPKWVEKKLQNFGEKSQNLFSDLIQLVFLEWGQQFNLLEGNKITTSLSIEQIEQTGFFELSDKRKINLPKGTFILKNNSGTIISFLGYHDSTKHFNKDENITFQLWFYDIHVNKYKINPLDGHLSFRVFRQSFYETIRYTIQRLFTLLEITSKKKLELCIYKSPIRNEKIKLTTLFSIKRDSAKKILNLPDYNLKVFKKAGFTINCQTKNKLYFQISNIRRDLKREIDLVEEYSRFIGYKNFKEIFPTKNIRAIIDQTQKIKNFFLINGFSEIQTSPLQENYEREKYKIAILNPISGDLESLRTEIISSCLLLLENNSRLRPEQTRFFEIGRTFHNQNGQIIEVEKVGGIFQVQKYVNAQQKELGWFRGKALIENFLETFGYQMTQITFSSNNISNFPFSHPTRTLRINVNGKTIGLFGQINPQKDKKINSRFTTYFFEFDLVYFPNWKSKYPVKTYQAYSKYPSIIRDLSFTFPQEVKFSKVKEKILTVFQRVKRINIFDLYFDKENYQKIKLGLRLEFRSYEKTLLAEIIDNDLLKIADFLAETFDGEKVG